MMAGLLLGLATALIAAVIAMLVAAALAAPPGSGKAELAWVYPDMVRLLWGLSRDRRVARPVRWRLLLALAYSAQPVNLIPDFIPVIGLADNIVVAVWAMRSAIRRSGAQVVAENWRGSDRGLTLAYGLCRLRPDRVPGHDPEPVREAAHSGHDQPG